jgi:hypothetical protein
MKYVWILLCFALTYAQADSPKSDVAAQPISTTATDPTDKNWKEYDNRIVKAHMRINAAWTVMEVKETPQSGAVSFTISRLPLVTFSVTRQPMEANFETYMSSASLTPQYPTGYKKSRGAFAGRVAFFTQGTATDGRRDESYFVTDEKSFYQISFSAPKESWKEAQPHFDGLKRSFRWLP